MQVSIITPCLDPGVSLKQNLESVAAQSYPDIEHIVVDGGSTDGTIEVLSGSSIRWISEPDNGQTSAINKGFGMARGDLLGWLNADDLLEPDAVSHVVRAMESTGAGWAYGNVRVIEGSRRYVWAPAPDPRDHLLTMGKGGVVPQPGSLIRRSALDVVGPLDESLHLAMDFDLWLRLIDAGIPHVYVPELLSTFTIHPESKTGKVGLAGFFEEEATVLAKSGRSRLADLALGRSAAHRARQQALPLKHALEIAIGDVQWPVEGPVALAGARTEAALIGGPSALTELLHLGPWLTRETRARLTWAFRKRLAGSK